MTRHVRTARSPARPGSPHTTVLITGFGPFPGVPVNATMRLVPELARRRARPFRTCAFATEMLATEWAAAPRRLDGLLAEVEARPGAALRRVVARARLRDRAARAQRLHGRRRMRRASCRRARRCATAGPSTCTASLPVQHIVARLRRRGIPAFVSRDAGGYLCNATLYHSLGCARGRAAAAASASSTSPRRSAGRAVPTAGASAPARSPGSRRGRRARDPGGVPGAQCRLG